MKFWQLLVLGLIFISLVCFYFFKQRPRNQEMGKLFITLLPELKKNEPDFIQVIFRGDKEKPLLFKKEKGEWVVFIKDGKEGFWVPVKQLKVKKLLSDLSESTGELRSNSSKYLSEFGLGAGQGIEIVLKKSGKEISKIVVGKKGPGWGSSFVKRDDENKVYLVSIDLLADFDIWTKTPQGPLEVRPWIDLEVIKLSPRDVQECSYNGEKRSWSVKKNKEKWTLIKDDTQTVLDDNTVQQILNKILPIRSKDVSSPKEFNNSNESFRCKDKSGNFYEITIGSCYSNDKICLIKSEKGYVYEVEATLIDTIRHLFQHKIEGKDSSQDKNIKAKHENKR